MALYLGAQLIAGDGAAADISVDQVLKSGEHIATLSANGTATAIYAPQQTECAMAGRVDSLSADILGISADMEELKESVSQSIAQQGQSGFGLPDPSMFIKLQVPGTQTSSFEMPFDGFVKWNSGDARGSINGVSVDLSLMGDEKDRVFARVSDNIAVRSRYGALSAKSDVYLVPMIGGEWQPDNVTLSGSPFGWDPEYASVLKATGEWHSRSSSGSSYSSGTDVITEATQDLCKYFRIQLSARMAEDTYGLLKVDGFLPTGASSDSQVQRAKQFALDPTPKNLPIVNMGYTLSAALSNAKMTLKAVKIKTLEPS